ncbi:MAG: DUF3089 domain-containing protein [Saprospiraceae bacterium]|jgi:hypothetical protein
MVNCKKFIEKGSVILFSLLILGCSTSKKLASVPVVPKAPNYSELNNWAAHPNKKDLADSLPVHSLEDVQETSIADVFFIHPTSYTNSPKTFGWNAPVDDPQLNMATDQSSILYQASIFNGVGRVFAPRYRQANLQAYFTADKKSAIQAFELAYEDVKNAFLHYLANENKGRPFIIAAHSQGTTHAKKLLREFIDGKELHQQLIATYLVGIPVENNYFLNIPICESPIDLGCFCSWRTFREGAYPKLPEKSDRIAVTNPLTWTTEKQYASSELNSGAILRDFSKVMPALTDAQISRGVLWVKKPKFPWSFLITRKDYHIADYNFFYLNVRENAQLRLQTFERKNKLEYLNSSSNN